jgi:hypothetical protein
MNVIADDMLDRFQELLAERGWDLVSLGAAQDVVGNLRQHSDLRIVFDWSRQYPDFVDNAYIGDPSPAQRWEWDEGLACLWIPGTKVAAAIGPDNTKFLVLKWNPQSRTDLGRHLGKSRIPAGGSASAWEQVSAFASGLEHG